MHLEVIALAQMPVQSTHQTRSRLQRRRAVRKQSGDLAQPLC